MDTYNLLTEDWIPVLYRNGVWKRIGVLKAFEEAHQIRQIAATNPMDRVAILRFLLALLYWCKGNPPHRISENLGEPFPDDWFARLAEEKDCFNLLGEKKRFYQDPSARRTRAATDLLQEIPTGNNFWHFRHSTDEMNGLCPACCAQGLLRLPLFSVSGLPDLKVGINGTPPIYVVPWATSLQATLVLNWSSRTELGTPSWTRPDIRPVAGEEVPLLTGLTLLSRRVWLHDPEGRDDPCTGCGSRGCALVRTCEFQTAGDQKNDLWNDPHVIYPEAAPRKPQKAEDLTAAGKFRMDRPWPDLVARMIEKPSPEFPGRAGRYLIVGFATDQAKNIDVWERVVDLPSTISPEEPDASFLRLWQKEGRRMEKRLGRSDSAATAVVAAIRPHVEHMVSGRVGELTGGAKEAWDQAAAQYGPMMKVIAGALSPGVTTTALQCRKQIASTRPNMQPRPGRREKPGRKKETNT